MAVGLLRALDGLAVEESPPGQKQIASQDVQGEALRANLLRRKAQKLGRQGILVGEV